MQPRELYHNKWLSLWKSPKGIVYSHDTSCNGQKVAVLGFASMPDGTQKFLGRFEWRAAGGDKLELSSLTGSVEHPAHLKRDAVRELYEEAGVKVEEKELIPLGTVRASKSCDTIVHLYGVDLSGKKFDEARGDGTPAEAGTYSKFVTYGRMVKCKDPLVHAMLLRLMQMKKIKRFETRPA